MDDPSGRLFVQQLRDFPNGLKDDGPDAAEGALRTALELFHQANGSSIEVID